jgi:hypothetical protein
MNIICDKCIEKDSSYALLVDQYHRELNCCKERIKGLIEENARLRRQNDALILDVAFYNKDFCHPRESSK